MRLLLPASFLSLFAVLACTSHETFPTGCAALDHGAGDFACLLPASASDVAITRDRVHGYTWLRFRSVEALDEVRANARYLGFTPSTGSLGDLPTLFLKGLGSARDDLSIELEYYERPDRSGARSWVALDSATGWIFIYGTPR